MESLFSRPTSTATTSFQRQIGGSSTSMVETSGPTSLGGNQPILYKPEAPTRRNSASLDTSGVQQQPATTNSHYQPPYTHGYYTEDNASESLQSSTDSLTTTSSFINHTKEQFVLMITSLQQRDPIEGWRSFFFYLLFQIYILYCQLIVPTVRDYNWGSEGKYVFLVLNFPITLLFQLVPYFGVIAISGLYMFIILLTTLFFLLAYRFTIRPSKHFKYVKVVLWYLSWTVKMTFLVGTHLLMGFLDCNLSKDVSITVSNSTSGSKETVLVSSLLRYSNVGCIEVNNGVMIALSSFFLVMLVFLYPLTEYVTSNSNPQSKVSLVSESGFIFSVLGLFNIVGLMIEFAVPIQYSYISAASQILISIACSYIIFKLVPFFTHYGNSLVQGVFFGRLGLSIGALVSSLVNTGNESGMGGGFVGLSVGLLVIGFGCGTIIQFLILWVRVKGVRDFFISSSQDLGNKSNSPEENILLNTSIERASPLLYSDMEDTGQLDSLNLFLKLSLMRSGNKDDPLLALHFVKGLAQTKMFKNVEALTYSALIVQKFWSGEQNAPALANTFLRKAMKNDPSFFQLISIHERIKEVETMSHSKNSLYEIISQIQKLEKNQHTLLSLHKDFWKEMVNEFISYDSIQAINRKIYNLTFECKSTLKNLYFNYSSNKTVLRLYANFIENFEFNSELADTLYAEANSLEEEEMRRKRRILQSKHSSMKKLNRVAPSERYETSSHSLFHEDKSSLVDGSDQHSGNIKGNDKMMDDIGADAVDTPQFSKETLFLNAISMEKTNALPKIISLIYFTFTITCLVVSIVLSVIYSYSVKSTVPFVEQVCFPGTIPYSIIRNVRSGQHWMNTFYFQEGDWPNFNEGFATVSKTFYINDHKNRLNNSITTLKKLVSVGQLGLFDYSSYSSNIYKVNFPNEDVNDLNLYSGKYQERFSSIVEITNSMIKYSELLMNDYPQELLLKLENETLNYSNRQQLLSEISKASYFNPLGNYNFAYIWANKELFTHAYEQFCANYLDTSISIINHSISQFMIYTVSILGVYISFSAMFIGYLIIELSGINNVIKLFETQIKKDTIAKIFHSISKKLQHDAIGNHSSLSLNQIKPKYVILLSTLFIIGACCGCLVLMFVESYLNGIDSVKIMTRVRLSVQTAVSVERIAFNAQEYYTYFATEQYTSPTAPLRYLLNRTVSFGDSRLWASKETFEELYVNVTHGVESASEYMSSLIYGSDTLNLDAVMGLYSAVDKIITIGTDNCTEYMRMNSIPFTYPSFKLYCQGLETVFSDFATTAPQIVMDSRRFYGLQHNALSNATILDPVPLAMRNNNLLRLSLPLISKFSIFIKEFVKASSNPSLTIVVISACFGVISIGISVLGFSTMLSNFWNQLHTFRSMLNYVPIDVIDENEKLRGYALHHNTYFKPDSRKQKKSKSGDEEDALFNLKVVFNSSVEGTMMCKENGDIELLNNSGMRMFGRKSIDILGTSMFDLFDLPFRDTIRKTVESLILKLKHKEGGGQTRFADETSCFEILEVDCLRRNLTKFPAKLSIYAVQFSGHETTTILSTFKDVTLEKKQNTLLSEEKKKSDKLLKNILPISVANRLKKGETFIAEKFDDITCFFSDMVGFTRISSTMQPTDLVHMLNTIVNAFDILSEKYDLEKIKTIGDAYFVVGFHNDHPERVFKFGLDTFGVIQQYNADRGNEISEDIDIRVGINTGPVVAGVIGSKKFAYDLWGDAVNTASRMESTGVPGTIQVSRSTYERIYDLGFEFEEREVDVKGKGLIKTYIMNKKHLMDQSNLGSFVAKRVSRETQNMLLQDERSNNDIMDEQSSFSNSVNY